jgi:hypothetical protein
MVEKVCSWCGRYAPPKIKRGRDIYCSGQCEKRALAKLQDMNRYCRWWW